MNNLTTSRNRWSCPLLSRRHGTVSDLHPIVDEMSGNEAGEFISNVATGQSLKEVSQITGLATANVKIRNHRAKIQMREALKALQDKDERNGAAAPIETVQSKADWQPNLEAAPLAA